MTDRAREPLYTGWLLGEILERGRVTRLLSSRRHGLTEGPEGLGSVVVKGVELHPTIEPAHVVPTTTARPVHDVAPVDLDSPYHDIKGG